jgi:hypothetical protein
MVSWGSALLANHGTALIYFGKYLQGFYMIFVEFNRHYQLDKEYVFSFLRGFLNT